MKKELDIGTAAILASLLFVAFSRETAGLKLIKVDVPRVVTRGEIATLRCNYQLDGDALYSVLWYKDNEEFYRYVPRNEPRRHSYRLEGFHVVTQKSNEHVVVLENITLKGSGLYRCEVSAEAPSFASVQGEGLMDVIVPPEEDPEITAERTSPRIGDVLNLNCTSGKSYPPARLNWFVNDKQTNSDYEAVLQRHELLSSISGLNLKILPHHFKRGALTVRCVSTLHESSATWDGEVALPIDRREALFQVEGAGTRSNNVSKWIIIMASIAIFLT